MLRNVYRDVRWQASTWLRTRVSLAFELLEYRRTFAGNVVYRPKASPFDFSKSPSGILSYHPSHVRTTSTFCNLYGSLRFSDWFGNRSSDPEYRQIIPLSANLILLTFRICLCIRFRLLPFSAVVLELVTFVQTPFARGRELLGDEYRRSDVYVALSDRACDRLRQRAVSLIQPIDPFSFISFTWTPPQSPRICKRRAHERSLLTVEGAAFIGEQRCSLCGELDQA